MIEIGVGCFAGLLALALACRLRPEGGPASAVDRVLGLFAIAADGAAGDFLGVAGFVGPLFLLAIERAGYEVDGVIVADAAASALGAGLAVVWLIDRFGGSGASAADAPRSLYTEIDPRLGEGGASDDLS